MTNTLQQRMQRWALRRQGLDSLPLLLRPRRLYILPTRSGLAFAAMVVVAFVAGLQYGSGLAMLLTFCLTGFALTAMLQTHRSLSGLRLLAVDAAAAFAGEPIRVRLLFDASRAPADLSFATSDAVVPARSDAREPSALELEFPGSTRGLWRVPVLRLETRAPFGLFRTWTWLTLESVAEIYPRPAGEREPPPTPGENPGITTAAAGLDELVWLRPFREGDSPRRVAWKAYARDLPLLVREYRGYSQHSRDFDFDALTGLDAEERLSQLCAWTLAAASHGERFRLCLPGSAPIEGQGGAHRLRCLSALARFGTTR